MEVYSAAMLKNLKTNLNRNLLVEQYFHAGYTADEMRCFLLICHGIVISRRHLYRILATLNLKRRGNKTPLNVVIRLIEEILHSSNNNLGYRSVHRKITREHGVIVSHSTVRRILRLLDPEGVRLRRQRRLRKRVYYSKGPNFSVHIDGWDKLKPYGISVHGAVDGFSRRLLWLHASSSNKNPRIIAKFYVDYLKENNGVPTMVCADRGTENVLIRDIQIALRYNHADLFHGYSSFINVTSPRNQRIEKMWGILRMKCGQFWMNLFQDLMSTGLLDNTNYLHLESVRYLFMDLVQADLNALRVDWNQHRVRRMKNTDSPWGKPDMLFYLPEMYNTQDYSYPLPGDLEEVDRLYCEGKGMHGCSPLFEELAVLILGRRKPKTVMEAIRMFGRLVNFLEHRS